MRHTIPTTLSQKQQEVLQEFFDFDTAEGFCEELDEIFNYSLEVERNNLDNDFFILRSVKKLIMTLAPK